MSDQLSLFGAQPVSRATAIEKLEEIKRAIAGVPEPQPAGLCTIMAEPAFDGEGETREMTFPEHSYATADAITQQVKLCRRQNMAWPRHDDDGAGICRRCGSRQPPISFDRPKA